MPRRFNPKDIDHFEVAADLSLVSNDLVFKQKVPNRNRKTNQHT